MNLRKFFPNYESLLADVKARLQENERIIVSTYGNTGKNLMTPALIAVTNSRLIRYSKLLFNEQFVSCPFESINLIDEISGFKSEMIKVHFLKGFIAFSLSPSGRFRESNVALMKELYSRINSKRETLPTPKSGTGDLLEELESLKNRKLVTEEEFQQKRKEILARL